VSTFNTMLFATFSGRTVPLIGNLKPLSLVNSNISSELWGFGSILNMKDLSLPFEVGFVTFCLEETVSHLLLGPFDHCAGIGVSLICSTQGQGECAGCFQLCQDILLGVRTQVSFGGSTSWPPTKAKRCDGLIQIPVSSTGKEVQLRVEASK